MVPSMLVEVAPCEPPILDAGTRSSISVLQSGLDVRVMGYGLWVMGYGLWVMGYGLWVMGYRLGARVRVHLSVPLRHVLNVESTHTLHHLGLRVSG